MTHDPSPSIREHSAMTLRTRGLHWQWVSLALLVFVSASGASCPQVIQQYTHPIPRALPPSPSLTQVIDVVNDNSARVQTLSTNRATITVPGFPTLNATINFMRPRSFRLVAQKFIGPEVDLGSNDEVFWFWMRRAQPPALFYCRHGQFGTSAARQILPVEPEWLIEALGVVTFDTAAPIEGPYPVGNGRVEIRTKRVTPTGPVSRVAIVDDSRGIVLENYVYDGEGTLLASAKLSKHTRDPASGVTLPGHVEIQWPPASLSLTLDLADVQINRLGAEPQQLFTKPVYSGYTEIDLAQPAGLAPVAPQPASAGGQFRAPPDVRYQ